MIASRSRGEGLTSCRTYRGASPGDVAAGDAWSITIFSASRVWGGAEEQTRLLATGLRRAGHQCRFVARRGGPVVERMREEGFSTFTLPGTGRSPWSIWRARRHLQVTRPDVVHFVDPHAVTCGGLASLGLGIAARVGVRHNAFPLRSPARYRLLCNRMICVCQVVADVCHHSGLPPSMLRVVRNGCVPVAQLAPDRDELLSSLGLSADDHILFTAAQLNECKGHRYLLQALPRVLQDHPRVRLVIAGTGPLEDDLRRQTRELGIESRVLFVGFRHDVRHWMRVSDLFVLPSLAEGMSAVLLEAMFEGCPIVTTSVGGTPEMLAPSRLGHQLAWLVPPARGDMLAAAITEALGDDEQRVARGARAERRARRDYTVERMVANTLSVYREIIEGVSARDHRVVLLRPGIQS